MNDDSTQDSFYGNFSIKDANNIGAQFEAECIANYSYEDCLIKGKVYTITIIEPILALSPLVRLKGENNRGVRCHLTRFKKIKQKG